MEKRASGLVVALLLTGISIAAPQDKGYPGQFMDRDCAKMGSDEGMMKKEDTKDAPVRAQKNSGKFVLCDAATRSYV